jgi:predicted RNA-binding protein Jag
LRQIAGLLGAGGADEAAEAELSAALSPLNPAERRIVASLASALVENRGR